MISNFFIHRIIKQNKYDSELRLDFKTKNQIKNDLSKQEIESLFLRSIVFKDKQCARYPS